MDLGNVVLYFPGDSPPLVRGESVAQHLPSEMVEAVGDPVRVSNAAEILEWIRVA